MNKVYFKLDKQKASFLAYELFCESSGLNKSGEKFQRMRKDALETLEKIKDRIDLKGEFLYFSKDEIIYENEKLIIKNEIISCKAFEQIDERAIEGVFLYACSAGDYSLHDDNILNQVYADLWGTSYIDAVRKLIYERLQVEGSLSDSFGPGFYGMSLSEVSKLAKILDFQSLGITVKDKTIMLPAKSCAGLYFHVNERYKKLNDHCEDCKGNQTSCKLCNVCKVNE